MKIIYIALTQPSLKTKAHLKNRHTVNFQHEQHPLFCSKEVWVWANSSDYSGHTDLSNF